ncbi:MAG: response regulator transcription factor [Lachnospiraceae bacterium]|nr:response regulator transcription factor [Lachnospiraceae bacterium]
MLSIAVCDDELLECLHIAARIRALTEELQIPCSIEHFSSGSALLDALDRFDLIFLDILMDGMDGMETARRCREQSFDKLLVFLTSSRRYVFDAYDVEAFHYLVKPVEDEKLKNVLRRAAQKESGASQDHILVSRERKKRKLFLDHILYFEIRGRQVEAHGEDGCFTYYEKIGALEEQLKGKGFFRCHKSYLVNLKHVDMYDRQEAVLDNGERIVIAKRRYEDFCQAILAYMRENGGIV